MAQYRKKPVVIEAITFEEFKQWMKENSTFPHYAAKYKGWAITHHTDECYIIETLEGLMNLTQADMLITGIKGEIYPCKKDIFEKTYEPVEKPDDTIDLLYHIGH